MTLVPTQVKVSVDPTVVTLGTLLRTTPSAVEGDDEQATTGVENRQRQIVNISMNTVCCTRQDECSN